VKETFRYFKARRALEDILCIYRDEMIVIREYQPKSRFLITSSSSAPDRPDTFKNIHSFKFYSNRFSFYSEPLVPVPLLLFILFVYYYVLRGELESSRKWAIGGQ
jgi:hypothetical protein